MATCLVLFSKYAQFVPYFAISDRGESETCAFVTALA